MAFIFNSTKSIEKPELVLFDLDNTLYDYDPAHQAAMSACCDKAHKLLGLSKADFKKAFDVAKQEIKVSLKNTASSHSRLLYFQRTIELLGMKTQVLLALDFEQTYWRTFLGSAKLIPGVKDFLEELKLLGVPLVVITDLTAQIQFRKLIYFRLDGYFDYVVTSEEVGEDKPGRGMFDLAIQKVGGRCGTIWMIGDDLEKDILAAKASCKAITFCRVRNGKGNNSAKADFEFQTFFDLLALVRNSLASPSSAAR